MPQQTSEIQPVIPAVQLTFLAGFFALIGATFGCLLGGLLGGKALIRLFLLTDLSLTGKLHIASVASEIANAGICFGALVAVLLALCCFAPFVHRRPAMDRILRHRGTWVAGSVFSAVAAGGLIFANLFVRIFVGIPTPADDVLIANFSRHKESFHQMGRWIEISQADTRQGVGTYEADQARVALHRAAFESAPQLSILGTDSAANVLPVWDSSSNWPIGDFDDKGYTYLPTPPSVIPSLDNRQMDFHESYTAYVHIDGNWYLYYRHTRE